MTHVAGDKCPLPEKTTNPTVPPPTGQLSQGAPATAGPHAPNNAA